MGARRSLFLNLCSANVCEKRYGFVRNLWDSVAATNCVRIRASVNAETPQLPIESWRFQW